MTGPIARCVICDLTFPVPDLDNQRLDDSELGRHLLTVHADILELIGGMVELIGDIGDEE